MVKEFNIEGKTILVNEVATPRVNGRPCIQYEVREDLGGAYHQTGDIYVGKSSGDEGIRARLEERFSDTVDDYYAA